MCSGLLYAPESPATSTLSLPIRLPSSVKGLRLGILIEGITSCGALPLPIMTECSGSDSSLMVRAWLAISSDSEAVMEFLRDEMPLMAEAGPGWASIKGVIGCERFIGAAVLTPLLETVSDTREMSSAWVSASLVTEAALDSRSWPRLCFDGLLGHCSDDPAAPCCFR